jgi:hypothetical protein
MMKSRTGSLLAAICVCYGLLMISCKRSYAQWQITSPQTDSAWTPFIWTGDSGQRAAMFVPVKMDGIPHRLWFQFDLGSDLSMLYETNARSVFNACAGCPYRITRSRALPAFWKAGQEEVSDCRLLLQGCSAVNSHCYVRSNYGEDIPADNLKDPESFIRMGTIGADFFANKVLIIDYPHQRFSISDSLPVQYATALVDINLDTYGRVVLPMQVGGRNYRVLFDNGSSMFPLITTTEKSALFAAGPNVDSIEAYAWGRPIHITGRQMKDSIILAGHHFGNVRIYTNHNDTDPDRGVDAIAGNALFWDKTLVIDFRHRKFGLF